MAGLVETDPITLTNALTGHNVIPGDVLKLRAGTYSLDSVNQIIGTSGNPVIIKAYEGERVILRGDFKDAAAEYVTYVDLEFTTNRDPNPAAYTETPGHNFSGTGVKIINCIMHDSVGLGCWDNADLIYGCITYNHGIVVSGIAYGHSSYTQNQDAAHNKIVKHNIFGRSANFGLHGYATFANLENFDVVENVLLPGSHHLIGSQKADDGIRYTNNHSFGGVGIGYGGHDKTNLTMTGNRMYNPTDRPFQLDKYTSGNISGNTFVSGVSGGDSGVYTVDYTKPVGADSLVMDNNTYYSRNGKAQAFHESGVADYTLAQWQATYGYDLDSTITLDGTSPNDSSHVYPNEFASVSKRKGLVVVWNWSGASSVNVDLTDIPINANAAMKIVNCEDPLADVVSATMPANKIYSFPMTGHTVAQVTGWAARPTAFPTLGAFMVET